MASKRRIRRKQCIGKKQYCNAGHAACEAWKKRNKTGDDIWEYRCPHCSWWHIGHRSAKKVR